MRTKLQRARDTQATLLREHAKAHDKRDAAITALTRAEDRFRYLCKQVARMSKRIDGLVLEEREAKAASRAAKLASQAEMPTITL